MFKAQIWVFMKIT